MTSVLAAGRNSWDVTVPDTLLENGVGTGWPTFLNESAHESLYAKAVQTGHWEYVLQGDTYEVSEFGGRPDVFWLCDRGGLTFEVAFVDPFSRPTFCRVEDSAEFVQAHGTSANVGHYIETTPVPLQLPHGANPLGSKLTQRLKKFRAGSLGAEGASGPVFASVVKLLSWLSGQSTAVSATVSSDGMLSIATEFPNSVRLYVEVERDGTVGAAVTRERRYARDLEEHTLADLTPEVILAAVRSI